MFKKICIIFPVICVILCLISVIRGYAQEEKLTITTYYPSPYGSYRELTAYRMKIGRTFSGSGYTVDDDNLIVEGRVGIGTAIDTGTKVRIHGPATAGSRTLTIIDDGATGVVSNLELGLATQSVANRPYIYANTNLAFGANGVERMVLNSIGNVGIGTDNPITRLTVQSQGIDNSRFINTISGGAGVLWVGDAGCPNNNSVGIGRVVPFGSGICGGDLGYDIVIKSDGNVGIGTPIPTSVASPANNQATANLDLNDVYLRSTGRWASQGAWPEGHYCIIQAQNQPCPTGFTTTRPGYNTNSGWEFILGAGRPLQPNQIQSTTGTYRVDGGDYGYANIQGQVWAFCCK